MNKKIITLIIILIINIISCHNLDEDRYKDDFEFGVDFSDLYTYTRGGEALPFLQKVEVYSGEGAVEFGDIGDSEISYFEIDIEAVKDTEISFYVKTDCESSITTFWDGFEFYYDNMQEPVIQWDNNEASEWRQYRQEIKAGIHTLRWQYVKDYSSSEGLDTAWVDKIDSLGGIEILKIEYNLSLDIIGEGELDITEGKYQKGSEITINATPQNSDWVFYSWSGDIDSKLNPIKVIMYDNMNITANFIDITNLDQTIDETFETNDFSKYNWQLGGANTPFIQDTVVYEGLYALQFGSIDDYESSSMSILVNNAEDLALSFYVKTDCETGDYSFYDGMKFYIDDLKRPVMAWDNSNASDWTEYICLLKSGFHEIKWAYEKDSQTSSGEDTAWIDNIKIERGTPDINVLNIENESTYNINSLVNEEREISFTIQNTGFAELNLGDIILSNTSDFDIIPEHNPSGSSINAQEDSILKLSITPAQTTTPYETTVTIPHDVPDTADYTFTLSVMGVDFEPGWLIMVYMDGDNNLESALWSDINEMEKGLNDISDDYLKNNTHIIVLWDGGYNTTPDDSSRIYRLGADSELDDELSENTVELTDAWFTNGSELNMGDGETIREFITYCKDQYPGIENKVLILSNHGGGVRSTGATSREICWDDTDGDSLSTDELQQAMIDSGCVDDKIDILGLDACLMGMVEEAYEYRNLADYFIASPQSEQADGWEFDHFLPQLTPATTPESFSKIIVESYRDSFQNMSDQSLTAVDLSELENLKTAIDNMAEAIDTNNNINEAKSILNSTYQTGQFYYIGDFCDKMKTSTNITQAVKDTCTDVLDALGNSIVYAWAGSSVCSTGYDGNGTEVKNGLTIVGGYYPSWYTDNALSGDFGYIDFCNNDSTAPVNSWAELLETWY